MRPAKRAEAFLAGADAAHRRFRRKPESGWSTIPALLRREMTLAAISRRLRGEARQRFPDPISGISLIAAIGSRREDARLMMRVLKEPLLHFVLAGAALFGAYAWLNRGSENPGPGKTAQIQISAGDVQWLVENWTTQWRRPPTHEDLRGLVADYLNEQLLAREARALGLEDNDVIIRRRLAQKLTFLIDDTMRRAEPTEHELQQYYAVNARRFRSDARISFVHVYFSPQNRADARSDATEALKLLLAEGGAPSAADLGDRLLTETEFSNETEQSISGVFGPGFARAVFGLDTTMWSGPIESGYGLHLVRVSAWRDAQVPPLSEMRERVVAEWKREQEIRARDRYLAELRRKYDIVADQEVKALIALPGDRQKGEP